MNLPRPNRSPESILGSLSAATFQPLTTLAAQHCAGNLEMLAKALRSIFEDHGIRLQFQGTKDKIRVKIDPRHLDKAETIAEKHFQSAGQLAMN